MSCSIPISTLISQPYNLIYGSSVYAKITAINIYGISITSNEGNGAVIFNVPNAPIISNDTPRTSAI